MSGGLLLSIVISSYNHADYISNSIQSLLNQDFTDFEMIIVDDASSDGSVEIIKKFKDSRIKLVSLERNLGVCSACNIGIKQAVGKYVKLFASDDVALPGMLKKQVSFLEKNEDYDAVFSKVEVIDQNNKILAKKTARHEKHFPSINRTRGEWLSHFFFNGNCLAAPTAMVRRDLLVKVDGFDERLAQAHDFDVWVKCCLYGKNIYVLPEKLVQYRRIQNSKKNMSSNTASVRKRLFFDNEKILENYLNIANVEDLLEIFPDLESVKDKITPDLIPFFLAKQALKKPNSLYHKQFALGVMYRILGNKSIKERLRKDFNFVVNKDFFALVTDNPLGVFSEKVGDHFCFKIASKFNKLIKSKA